MNNKPPQPSFQLKEAQEIIKAFISAWKQGSGVNSQRYLGVSDFAKAEAKEHGTDLTDITHHLIDKSSIRHIFRRHGEGNETEKDQLPITEEDFGLIPEIVQYPDMVVYGRHTGKGLASIIYSKYTPNGTMILIEAVRTGTRVLALTTFWKRAKNKKNPEAQVAHALNSALKARLPQNVRNDFGLSSDVTIADRTKFRKTP